MKIHTQTKETHKENVAMYACGENGKELVVWFKKWAQGISWNISYGRVVKVVFSQTSSYINSSNPIPCCLMDFSKSFFQKYSFDLPSVVTSPPISVIPLLTFFS